MSQIEHRQRLAAKKAPATLPTTFTPVGSVPATPAIQASPETTAIPATPETPAVQAAQPQFRGLADRSMDDIGRVEDQKIIDMIHGRKTTPALDPLGYDETTDAVPGSDYSPGDSMAQSSEGTPPAAP